MARYQGNRLGAQDRSSLFLTIQCGRTVIALQAPLLTSGPRASSVQVDSIIPPRVHLRSMVNTADKSPQVDTRYQYIFCGNIFSIVLAARFKPVSVSFTPSQQ